MKRRSSRPPAAASRAVEFMRGLALADRVDDEELPIAA